MKFSGGSFVNLEKKENFCVVFTYSIKRAREIFEVSCRSRATTAKKFTKPCSVMYVRSCGFANKVLLFAVLVAVADA